MTEKEIHELRNLRSKNQALSHLLLKAQGHIEELLRGLSEERIAAARKFVSRLAETDLGSGDAPPPAETPPQAPAGDDLLKGKSVLVVEDEKLPGLSLKVMLLDLGASEVRICDQFEACRAMIKNVFQPHAALVDLDMAGRDARPIARELKELEIPFVFHTGSQEDGELRAEFGDIPVLRKPAPAAAIAAALATVLE